MMVATRRIITTIALFALALALPRLACADGPPPEWVVIAEDVRITFYGDPPYTGDGSERMASGSFYRKDADIAALGKHLLELVRDHYAREAAAMGRPLDWGWKPGLQFWYTGIAGCYFVPISLDEARLWGCGLRLSCRNAAGAWYSQEVRLMDTGGVNPVSGVELGVDLPDETWLRWGYPFEAGVFICRVEVLAWQ